jgi:regulatory protein
VTIAAAAAEDLGLEAGRAWTKTLAERVERHRLLDQARRVALQCLGRRAMSTSALRARLIARTGSEFAANTVVDEFIRDGWLDDHASAVDYAASLLRASPAAASYLAQRLEARGIDAGTAARAAATALADIDLDDAAATFIRRKAKTMRSLSAAARARRLAGLLARRGFDADAAMEVLRRAGVAPDDE